MTFTNGQSQSWIHSRLADSTLILLPPILAVGLVFCAQGMFGEMNEVPLWAWVSFILCVDVAHVYSTLFRTYLNSDEFRERRTLLTFVPLACWLSGVLLYSIDAMVFWRALAYVAVFHFARQQYGFMALYSRRETHDQRRCRWIDQGLIYLATGYPVVYWHTHLPRNFHWFIEGDFATGLPAILSPLTAGLYISFAALYLLKETFWSVRLRAVNVPKQFVLIGTAASWYFGIVALNGDLAFTITNVLSHGIPYIGLIWIFGRKQAARSPQLRVLGRVPLSLAFSIRMIPLFLGFLFLFAFLEEGFWHGLVWREHLGFFSTFSSLPRIEDHATLAWLVPLLALPQATHYVLDAFIWRLREPDASWKQVVFQQEVRVS